MLVPHDVPELALFLPIYGCCHEPEVPLGDSCQILMLIREDQLLLNVRCQVEEIHHLGGARPRDIPQAGDIGVVQQLAV